LLRALQAEGLAADHVITLGWRGVADAIIRERLQDPQIVFFTQDNDFLFGEPVAAVVVRSRVRQARPLAERIVIWLEASRQLAATSGEVRLYELTDEGLLLPWLESR
jgi:hypothetical protein